MTGTIERVDKKTGLSGEKYQQLQLSSKLLLN